MRRINRLRAWDIVHRWSSLICTLFLALLCLTGLPLIFQHEIDHLQGLDVRPAALPAGAPFASLDRIAESAVARHPHKIPLFASHDAGENRIWYVTMGSTFESTDLIQVAIDARSAAVLAEPRIGHGGVMGIVRSLHVDLFAGLPGELFLGSMGILFLLSLVSGVVLYAPFMRKAPFGEVRRGRGQRARWLDLHNLIGIATLTWAVVVGGTGAINTCADLIIHHWQAGQLAHMLGLAHERKGRWGADTAQQALDAARDREPNLNVAFIAFPGSSFAGPRHYGVYMRGSEPLTARLVKPVLVDEFGAVLGSDLPWYLTALFVSQPLHFGDYGGLPMKIMWAALDVATLVVLGSGLYLWLVRARRVT